MSTPKTMEDWAVWYAGTFGWHIFPLRPETKEPFSGLGVYKATSNPEQIRAWWARWSNANIGLHCGPSGVLALDLDKYKENYAGERLLSLVECNTTTSLTGSGGEHLLYQMPSGEKFGNGTGTLPAGLDARGYGGYIVLPPSLHPSGRRYQWENGYGPHEVSPKPLPQALYEEIRAAQRPAGKSPSFSEIMGPKPDLARWNLTKDIRNLIDAPPPRGERSEADQGVIFALVCAGASDDEIRAVFEHYPIGKQGKYGEKKSKSSRQATNYLAASIAKARSFLANTARPRQLEQNDEIARLLLREGANDEGNAQAVSRLYSNQFLYTDAYGWLHYGGQAWRAAGAEANLDRAIVDTLQRRRLAAVQAQAEPVVKAATPNYNRVKGCKALLQSIVYASVDDFDDDPNVLNCANGVLDLRTGTLLSHDPGQRFTYCLPVAFDPNANSTTWVDFLAEAVGGDPQILDYLQQAVGYSLTGHTREECFFYLYGPTRSGKGTFTETLHALLGKPLAVEVDFTTFTMSRDDDSQNFALAPLKPCRLVVASESNRYQRLNEAKIKVLTGGNDVRCAFKHRDSFSYRPQYKIWFSSNEPIYADVEDDAVWIRPRIVKFPNSFAGREDKGLKARLRQLEQLQAVLAWSVKGAQRWYQSAQGLRTPSMIVRTTQQQRDALDHVQTWLDECCTAGDWTSNVELYASYMKWCPENGVTSKPMEHLGRALARKGFVTGVQRKVAGQRVRGVAGVRLSR